MFTAMTRDPATSCYHREENQQYDAAMAVAGLAVLCFYMQGNLLPIDSLLLD